MGIERFTDGQFRNTSQLAAADEHPALAGIADRVVDDGVLKNASRRQNRRRFGGRALDCHLRIVLSARHTREVVEHRAKQRRRQLQRLFGGPPLILCPPEFFAKQLHRYGLRLDPLSKQRGATEDWQPSPVAQLSVSRPSTMNAQTLPTGKASMSTAHRQHSPPRNSRVGRSSLPRRTSLIATSIPRKRGLAPGVPGSKSRVWRATSASTMTRADCAFSQKEGPAQEHALAGAEATSDKSPSDAAATVWNGSFTASPPVARHRHLLVVNTKCLLFRERFPCQLHALVGPPSSKARTWLRLPFT